MNTQLEDAITALIALDVAGAPADQIHDAINWVAAVAR